MKTGFSRHPVGISEAADGLVEQFKKDVVVSMDDCYLEVGTHIKNVVQKHALPPFLRRKILNHVLAHPFLVSLMDKAKKYDELLELTRDTCPECKGEWGERSEYICLVCGHTGKTEPHPERLAVYADELRGEVETRKSLAEGHGITFPNAEEAIKWLKGGKMGARLKKGTGILIKAKIERDCFDNKPEKGYWVTTSRGSVMVNTKDIVNLAGEK